MSKLKLKHIAASAMIMMAGMLSASAQNNIQIAAHRGFWQSEKAKQSQNSIMALKQAQKNGFWGSEFDVHLTADNVIILNHDDDIEGHAIKESTYEQLKAFKLGDGEIRPTLDQYLKVAGKTSTMIVLEIKDQGSDERTIQLADMSIQKLLDHGLYDPSRVMFITFNLAACKHIAKIAPEFVNQYLNGDVDPDTLKGYGINGIDYKYTVLKQHPEWVSRCHELGMSVNCWTVDKEADIDRMIELGVDCITTNKPLYVREKLGAREVKAAK